MRGFSHKNYCLAETTDKRPTQEEVYIKIFTQYDYDYYFVIAYHGLGPNFLSKTPTTEAEARGFKSFDLGRGRPLFWGEVP